MFSMKMKSDVLVLALGSNLGDRENCIKRAVDLLSGHFGPVKDFSGILETEAVYQYDLNYITLDEAMGKIARI